MSFDKFLNTFQSAFSIIYWITKKTKLLIPILIYLLLNSCSYSKENKRNLKEKGISNANSVIKKELDICILKSNIIFNSEEVITKNIKKEVIDFFFKSEEGIEPFFVLIYYESNESFDTDFKTYINLIDLIKDIHKQYMNKISLDKFNVYYDKLSKTKQNNLGNKLILSEISSSEYLSSPKSFIRAPKCLLVPTGSANRKK